VLGLVLARAAGRPLAEYLEQKIWQPIGAEADALWLVDNSGQEATYFCMNAVLRDYARIGLLLAHDGNWRGRQIIPAAWVLEATTVHVDQPHLWPGAATESEGSGLRPSSAAGDGRALGGASASAWQLAGANPASASSDELPSPDRLLLRRYHYHGAGRVGADVPRRAAQRDVEQAPLAVASDH
jgi:CubicO group peptidase (beta-lactamase class C family)